MNTQATKHLVPSRKDLMYPTLLALKTKGGSASLDDLAEQVASDMNLSNKILNIPAPSKKTTRTFFRYNLAWACSILKKAKAIENPARCIWAITEQGKKIKSEKELQRFLRQKNSRQYKASRISHKPKGSPWSPEEIDIIVDTYFEMLQMEQRGEAYVKLKKNKELQKEIGRTHRSIEFKLQNISAVLQRLAMDWIPGYKPAVHFQHALIAGVERYLDASLDASTRLNASVDESKFLEQTYLIPEPAPTMKANEPEEALAPLARKWDPAERDAHNRELGKRGEKRILSSERAHLINVGREDLAEKVKWVSEEEGDGLGYDIRSFSPSGDKRLLEVKTTARDRYSSFYLTENELRCSREKPNEFRLVRLYDFKQDPKVFELAPPLEDLVNIRPTAYLASFS